MGEIIRFPDDANLSRGGKYVGANTEPATVIILPVIRIERPDGSNDSEPHAGPAPGKRRKRRAAR